MRASITSSPIKSGVALAYVAIAVVLIAAAAVTYGFPQDLYVPSRGLLAPPVVGAFLLFGAAGAYLARRIGFPDPLDPKVGNRERLFIPILFGLLFGLITVAGDLATSSHDEATPFPYSIPVFVAGGVLIEILLRLVLLSVVYWLARFLMPTRRNAAFWIAATLVALYEPLPFVSSVWRDGHLHFFPLLVVARLFASNLLSAKVFRDAGFVAPVTMRWTDYLVWHVVWPAIRGGV